MQTCEQCGHPKSDHTKLGPKKDHAPFPNLQSQIAATVEWKKYPATNGEYVYYPTINKAFCEQPLCTCTDYVRN